VQGAEVVHKVVGESEKAIAQVFARARAAAPAILFIDQIDMLARPRGADSSGI
jgi:SpoVK/Ycf46/Vps4 family AAA+-type ATPase